MTNYVKTEGRVATQDWDSNARVHLMQRVNRRQVVDKFTTNRLALIVGIYVRSQPPTAVVACIIIVIVVLKLKGVSSCGEPCVDDTCHQQDTCLRALFILCLMPATNSLPW